MNIYTLICVFKNDFKSVISILFGQIVINRIYIHNLQITIEVSSFRLYNLNKGFYLKKRFY